jgi:hypothetical protein
MKFDQKEPCQYCDDPKALTCHMGHGSYKCRNCYKAMWCPKCQYQMTTGHTCPSAAERRRRQRSFKAFEIFSSSNAVDKISALLKKIERLQARTR